MAIEKYGIILETEHDVIRVHNLPGTKKGTLIKCTYRGEAIEGVFQFMEGSSYGEFTGNNGSVLTVHKKELDFHA